MVKYILYGAGRAAQGFRLYQDGRRSEIIAVCDKNSEVQGTGFEINGKKIRIESPDYLHSIDYDAIIVSSSKYYAEIKGELIAAGISSHKILSVQELENKVLKSELFQKCFGVEVGGPSEIFKGIYEKCNGCDGVNWSSDTVWTGKIDNEYKYNSISLGKTYICDATNLMEIENEKYDFYLSSNNLEHIANPLKAMNEAVRIVKKGGLIEIIVPEKTNTFDHRRKNVTFKHILEDEENNIKENDLSHLNEILEQHDIMLDPGVKSLEEFKIRSIDNYHNRCLHQHVFDKKVVEEIFKYIGLSDITVSVMCNSIFAFGRK